MTQISDSLLSSNILGVLNDIKKFLTAIYIGQVSTPDKKEKGRYSF